MNRFIVSLALAAGASGDALADQGADQQLAELTSLVHELRAEIDDLRGQDDHWLTERRAEEVRMLVNDVLADADTRASLLQSGMTAGYDGGLVVQSSDGNFKVKVNGVIQARYVFANNDGRLDTGGPGTTNLNQTNWTTNWSQFLDPAYNDANPAANFVAAGNQVGLMNYQAAITGQLSASQATTLGQLIASYNALGNTSQTVPFGAGPEALARAGQAVYDFYNNALAGFTTAQRDAFATALGVTDLNGNAITTFTQYQTYLQSAATRQLQLSRLSIDSDGSRGGFEMRRTKLAFSGHVLNPNLTYKIQGGFNRGNSGQFRLEDALINYDLGNGWSVQAGQYYVPTLREQLVSSKRQLAVERSLVNGLFTTDRSQGVSLLYDSDAWRMHAMFSDGLDQDNTPALNFDTEYAFSARAELLLGGTWKQFRDFTSKRGSESGLMLGAAVHTEKQESGTTALRGELETLQLTADVSFEADGWNLYGAVVYGDLDSGSIPNAGALMVGPGNDTGFATVPDQEQIGFIVQGGYYITDDTELFARYEWADLDLDDIVFGPPGGGIGGIGAYSFDDLSVLTVGFNKYWNGHNTKWTTDIGIGLDRVESPAASSGAGWLSDTGGDDGQIVIRSQLQLVF